MSSSWAWRRFSRGEAELALNVRGKGLVDRSDLALHALLLPKTIARMAVPSR